MALPLAVEGVDSCDHKAGQKHVDAADGRRTEHFEAAGCDERHSQRQTHRRAPRIEAEACQTERYHGQSRRQTRKELGDVAAVEPAKSCDTPCEHRRFVGDFASESDGEYPVAAFKHRHGHYRLAWFAFGGK